MPQNKTTETANSIETFINSLSEETKRNDSFELIKIIKEHTGLEPSCGVQVSSVLAGISIVTTAVMREKRR